MNEEKPLDRLDGVRKEASAEEADLSNVGETELESVSISNVGEGWCPDANAANVDDDRPEPAVTASTSKSALAPADEDGSNYGDLTDPEVQLAVYESEIEGFAKDGKGYKGRCPFHPDHDPSLRINLKNGKWVWFCHPCTAREGESVGGNAFELLKRLGKLPKAKKDIERKDQPTMTYDYTDKDGKLLFQALRFGDGKGKTFRQRQPDGKGGWIWSVPEEVRTLYNLPEVTKADQVMILEGEKDVETARRLGFAATTNPLGATKWLQKYSELLAGKDVIVIPDNDAAGDKHRKVVLQALCECLQHPESIKVVQLRTGKDLTEWVEAGGSAPQLSEAIANAAKFAYVDSETGKFIVVGEREYDVVLVCKTDLAASRYKNLGFETVVREKGDDEHLATEVAGKNVVLTFKNEAVVDALLAEAQSLKIVTGLAKSAEEYLAWVAAAPDRRIRLVVSDADAFLKKEIPPREVLMKTRAGSAIFYAQSINQIFAWRGTGKTYIALGIVKALVCGGKFLTWRASRPTRVLYVEGEIPASQLQDRLKQVIGKSSKNLRIITLDEQPDNEIPSLLSEYGRKLIEEAIGDAEVLVLDSISTLFNFSTNDEENWLAVNAWLKKLRSKGLCIVFLHHAGKTGLQRGSSKAEDLLDTSIKLEQPGDYRIEEGLRANLTFDKTRGVAMIDGEFQVSMEIKDEVAEFFGGAIGKGKGRQKTDNYEQAKVLFEKHPEVSLKALERRSGIPDSSLHRYKEQWLEEKAKKDEPKRSPFIGAEDQVKKPPARELLAKRAMTEGAEVDKKRA
jgi:5S rRNA maturation endonuclease (ribonuclease M5)